MQPHDSHARWVVAHSGARDEYQLPLALHEAGRLDRFVTDVYAPLDRPLVRLLMMLAPKRVRTLASQRFQHHLPSRKVKDFKIKRFLQLKSVMDPHGLALNGLVGDGAAHEALHSRSNLLITSYYGWAAFPLLRKETTKVLFQVHPHPKFLRNLYRCHGEAGDQVSGFQSELEMLVDDEFLSLWGQESLDADLVIAASEFTRRSLLYAGVKPDRVMIVPYGVDGSVFSCGKASLSGCPKILFVGQAVDRKGFRELLGAWEGIRGRKGELHVVSRISARPANLAGDASIIWHERLPLSELVALMNSADLLVLPSIAEGFGHVLLQALSCGTPILCSDATAGPDLLRGWEDGFIFKSGDWHEFGAKLDYWLTHVDRLRLLRKDARALAERFTWTAFREGIRNACDLATRSEQLCGAD